MLPAILGTLGLILGVTSLYIWFRPPQGDATPIPEENLRHILRQEMRKGEEP